MPPARVSRRSPSLRARAFRPCARALAGLLGPCFETGRTRPAADGSGAAEVPPRRRVATERPEGRAAVPRRVRGGAPGAAPLAPRRARLGRGRPAPEGTGATPRLSGEPGAPSAPSGPAGASRRRDEASRSRDPRRRAAARRGAPRSGGGRRPGPLPPRRFRALLTLLSESFSPFRRRTCSLSASPSRSALDEVRHPIRAAFPGDPTPGRLGARRHGGGGPERGLRPPRRRPSRRLVPPTRARAGASSGHSSRSPEVPRFGPGSVRFARRY